MVRFQGRCSPRPCPGAAPGQQVSLVFAGRLPGTASSPPGSWAHPPPAGPAPGHSRLADAKEPFEHFEVRTHQGHHAEENMAKPERKQERKRYNFANSPVHGSVVHCLLSSSSSSFVNARHTHPPLSVQKRPSNRHYHSLLNDMSSLSKSRSCFPIHWCVFRTLELAAFA